MMTERRTRVELRGRRVTVMGLGTFGGGSGAVRFLLDRGAHVTVTDVRHPDELAPSLADFESHNRVTLRLGGHDECDFTNADLVVVNPAVARDNPFLQAAQAAGVPLTSEMNLFWQHCRGRIIGVTGSNGKSTTAALTHALLQAAGLRCRLGGNIGRSLLPEVDGIEPDEWVVLELSSFQLDDLDRIHASPDVAVVTNLTPNHLDRHGTLDAYRQAKQTILRWQVPPQLAVLNQDDPDVAHWPVCARALYFGTTDMGAPGVYQHGMKTVVRTADGEWTLPLAEWLTLPGDHNLQNALAATCAALAAGIDRKTVQCGLQGYVPLPHRLQFVAEIGGVEFYNDSLATTPESAIAALDAFSQPTILLAGGYDKQVDLSQFAQSIAGNAKAVALMGQTAVSLDELIAAAVNGSGTGPATCRCNSPREAFEWACSQAEPGDVVLLSPGCASYGWFRNFADRGEQFMNFVKDHAHTVDAGRRS